nr:MAG TPA: hypothetical protein [Caudoviricetes sp.]
MIHGLVPRTEELCKKVHGYHTPLQNYVFET